MGDENFLVRRLEARQKDGLFRTLEFQPGLADFTSNDYLGIRKKNLLRSHFDGSENHGAGGSRLLSGNYPLTREVEKRIATFHEAPAALIFNSGYDANVGLMSAVSQRGDTIFYDQLCHASIRDGIRLSLADSFSFAHNDIGDLKRKLTRRKGNCFVVTESIFSMDGDLSPLLALTEVCKEHNLHLIVDEAHAIGVVGERGEGLTQHLGLHHNVFARVYTFGKAPGCHGAAVAGSEALISTLVNFARPFIYSTALPEIAVRAIDATYKTFPAMSAERRFLTGLIAQFRAAASNLQLLSSDTPIQGVIVEGNERVCSAAVELRRAGFDIRPIRQPTVPKGSERLRINLHAFNTPTEIDALCEILNRIC